MGYSTTMRYTGLSGIDVEGMVTQLMKAESMKYDSVYRKKMILQYTQDSYRQSSNKILDFQNKYLSFTSASSVSNMRSSATFGKNKTTVTGSNGSEFTSSKGTVTASNTAAAGSYDFTVKSVASAEKRTGGSMTDGAKIEMELGAAGSNKLTADDKLEITLNGTKKTIDFSKYAKDGLSDAEILQNAINGTFGAGKAGGEGSGAALEITDSGITVASGTNISFAEGSIKNHSVSSAGFFAEGFSSVSYAEADRITTNKRMKYPGEGEDSITESFKVMVGGEEKTIEFTVDANEDSEAYKTAYADALNAALEDAGATGANAKIDSEGYVYFEDEAGMGGLTEFNGGAPRAVREETFTVAGKDVKFMVRDGMTKAEYINQLNVGMAFEGITSVTASADGDDLKFKVTRATNEDIDIKFDSAGIDTAASGTTLKPTSSLQDLNMTSTTSAISTTDTLSKALGITGSGTLNINGVDINYTEDMTLKQFMSAVNANNTGVSLSYSGTTGKFTLNSKEQGAGNAIKIQDDNDILGAMKLTESTGADIKQAQDTVINYDGVDISRDTATVEIDGITLNLTSKAEGETITVDVERDKTNTVETIKGFVNAYNEMIESLQSELKTQRPKSDSYNYFEPLTSEEREAMSETEQEQWDEKAKSGMLYNDSLLRRFTSSMRSISYQSVTLGNGDKISLQDLGITTGDYMDGGKLTVDSEKLESAIEKYGDDIMTLFTKDETGIAEKMNKAINDAIGTSGYITNKAGRENTLSNTENTLTKSINKQDDDLEDLKAYLTRREEYYYSMFATMEKAITNSNNQMSYLTSMFA